MAPTSLTRSVSFHGWKLPKGSRVHVVSTRAPITSMGQQEPTATVESYCHDFEGRLSLPVSALASVEGAPQYRYDEATGRDIEVAS